MDLGINKKFGRVFTEMLAIQSNVQEHINEMIADAVAHGEYYLLAKRIADNLRQDVDRSCYKMSDFPGLTQENKRSVFQAVCALLDDYEVTILEKWSGLMVQIKQPEYGSRCTRLHSVSFMCNGKRYKFSSLDLHYVALELFGVASTYTDLPSRKLSDAGGVVTWYEYTADTFDASETDYLFFGIKRKRRQERPAKRHKPLDA
jgi:hypothetical protein